MEPNLRHAPSTCDPVDRSIEVSALAHVSDPPNPLEMGARGCSEILHGKPQTSAHDRSGSVPSWEGLRDRVLLMKLHCLAATDDSQRPARRTKVRPLAP